MAMDSVTILNATTAKAYATINSIGTRPITQHGFCWALSNNEPTTNDFTTELGNLSTQGTFNNTIHNLIADSTYFIRAYITNDQTTINFKLAEPQMVKLSLFNAQGQLQQQSGFDAVIGNPPYVRQEALKPFKGFFGLQFGEVVPTFEDGFVEEIKGGLLFCFAEGSSTGSFVNI